ncbi:MAG: 3-methyl-2-oxobutanoate hydroxymethyltransferase [Candidatus Adiutrix sp.]|nr:3-methyl-2-oxobutanoate hydroxymethyltransferase [Candidatus Adiutrix sp.]
MTPKTKKKMTVADFKRYKQEGRKFTYVTAYDYTMASIVNESQTEVILVGDSLGMVMLGYASTVPVTLEDMIHHTRPVVRGAPDTFVAGDLPFGSYNVSAEEAVRQVNRLVKETLCDCVKLEGGAEAAETVRAIVASGTPVMGHIGLTPQTAASLGGLKVQGVTPEGARKIIADARALEEAGAFSIVVECVPVALGQALSAAVAVPILGIGAGPHVDCQVLVLQDLLGMYGDLQPRFVRRYANLRADIIRALNQFNEETRNGAFPGPEHCFNHEVALERIY